jgi:DNA modification methylase
VRKAAQKNREPLLFEELRQAPKGRSPLADELFAWRAFGKPTGYATTTAATEAGRVVVDTFINEYWSSAQRQGHGLHEVSYRACFKPELPAFFVERLTKPGDVVHDPFMGRGTTLLEAALRGRVPSGNDVNPLSAMLLRPRLSPPRQEDVDARLSSLDLSSCGEVRDDLLAFYHPDTLREIGALRSYLIARAGDGTLDAVDDWIRMVAVNRLTGHSPGFLSVYTMPPNQAVSVAAQLRINEKRNQKPPRRDLRAIVARKSKALLAAVSDADRATLAAVAGRAVLSTAPANATPAIPDASVDLVVTSPPFLDIVQYKDDNWLRCWFCGIDAEAVQITMSRTVDAWAASMRAAFLELRRVVKPGGHVAFEVGEVRRGSVRLEEVVLPVAVAAGFVPELVMIHAQKFTKTANCWGIGNNDKGTNTQRVVVLRG